jgi:hypothetical protein
MAWAEDRAPWRHDLSADPGTKTEGGRHDAALSLTFGIGTKAVNRRILIRRTGHLVFRPWFLHFTLNHYSRNLRDQAVQEPLWQDGDVSWSTKRPLGRPVSRLWSPRV